jgi:hypothetical protein
MAASLRAQTLNPRVIATPSDPVEISDPVWETAIAAGQDNVIAVCIATGDTGYAIGQNVAGTFTWVEQGTIPESVDETDTINGAADPVVAVSEGNQFVVVAMQGAGEGSAQRRLVTTRFNNTSGQWEKWVDQTQYNSALDHPRIVAGEYQGAIGGNPGVHEFYSTVSMTADGTTHRLFRTTNGGKSYTPTPIKVNGQSIGGTSFGMHPTVAGAGPLYIAYPPCPNPKTR